MNSLKTVVIVALLAAVGYGVYVSITRNPRQTSDLAMAPPWSGAQKGQLPGPGGTAAPLAGNGGMAGAPGGGISLPFAAGATSGTSAAGAAQNGTAPGSSAGPGSGLASFSPPLIAPGTPATGANSPSPKPVAVPAAMVLPAVPPPGYPAIAENASAGLPPGNPPPAADNELLAKFAAFMQAVQAKLDEKQLDDGLRALSMLYNNPDLPPAPARQVTELLDQLAGTVIYSRQHWLETPYKVQPGERLEQIAQKYNVPWELLARINGIRSPDQLTPGQELKVVRGPFHALINLDRCELTLILQDRYAGRFPIGIGRDSPRLEGSYEVRDKIVEPIYCGSDGSKVPAGDRNNPLGRCLLDLGNQVGIHGTNDPRTIGRTDGRGVISLGDRDIDDLFGILSIGSRVVIQR